MTEPVHSRRTLITAALAGAFLLLAVEFVASYKGLSAIPAAVSVRSMDEPRVVDEAVLVDPSESSTEQSPNQGLAESTLQSGGNAARAPLGLPGVVLGKVDPRTFPTASYVRAYVPVSHPDPGIEATLGLENLMSGYGGSCDVANGDYEVARLEASDYVVELRTWAEPPLASKRVTVFSGQALVVDFP